METDRVGLFSIRGEGALGLADYVHCLALELLFQGGQLPSPRTVTSGRPDKPPLSSLEVPWVSRLTLLWLGRLLLTPGSSRDAAFLQTT